MKNEMIDRRDLQFHEVTIHTSGLAESLVQMFIEVFPDEGEYVDSIHLRVERALDANPVVRTHQ